MSPRASGDVFRGQIYFVEYPQVGRKPVVIVSNNRRNRALRSVVGCRITSALKTSLPTFIPLAPGDPLHGGVLCDDIVVIPKSMLSRPVGVLSAHTLAAVGGGLKVALDL